MNKICTSIEQSKKLIELGVDADTADMFYADILVDGVHKYNLHPLESYGFKTFGETKLQTTDHLGFIPAWSLSALLDILAKETHNIDEDGYVTLSSYKGNWWDLSPINCDSEEIKDSNNPLDAAFEMLVWLKENGKI